jgi:hypothetical protein
VPSAPATPTPCAGRSRPKRLPRPRAAVRRCAAPSVSATSWRRGFRARGIYNEDEDRIREVVVLEETVEQATQSFGTLAFSRRPRPEDISFTDTEILRADQHCLAVWTVLGVEGFVDSRASGGVEILRWAPDRWKSLTTWQNRDDLWEPDCDSSLS